MGRDVCFGELQILKLTGCLRSQPHIHVLKIDKDDF